MRIRQQTADWRTVYNHFLTTPQWKVMKALVLKRCGGVCECCLTRPFHTAHHSTYPQPATLETLGAQPLWQLKGICSQCHDLFTGTAYTGPKAVVKRTWGSK